MLECNNFYWMQETFQEGNICMGPENFLKRCKVFWVKEIFSGAKDFSSKEYYRVEKTCKSPSIFGSWEFLVKREILRSAGDSSGREKFFSVREILYAGNSIGCGEFLWVKSKGWKKCGKMVIHHRNTLAAPYGRGTISPVKRNNFLKKQI